VSTPKTTGIDDLDGVAATWASLNALAIELKDQCYAAALAGQADAAHDLAIRADQTERASMLASEMWGKYVKER
jgi:hypothetical protein